MAAPAELVIEAGRTEANYWRDLWRYKELFYFLAWRDILVRYKQTAIGVAWALIRPFLTMVILTVVFNKVARLPGTGDVPYALMVFAAMLPWQFFATALSESSGSLVGNASLISKVYFPRLIVPGTSVITAFVDFLITLALMALLMVWYGFAPGWRLLTLPLFIVLAIRCRLRGGHVAVRVDGEISRFSLRRSLHRSVWPVHLPGRLQQRQNSAPVANSLRLEPDGRDD